MDFSHMGGVELSIPEVAIESGKTAEIPLFIDRIDNLAGVKLVIRYDKELLTFKKGIRGRNSRSSPLLLRALDGTNHKDRD
jgi:hypothetical protein